MGRALAVCACLALLLAPVLAQAPQEPASQAPLTTFRTGADLVALNITVVDREQRFVTGLTRDDFAVYEDGVQQDISFFAAMDVPIDLIIMLDTSASMQDKLGFVQEAASRFAQTLRPVDRGEVLAFGNEVRVLQPFTSDVPTMEGAIRSTTAQGGTALYNALYIALQELTNHARRSDEIRRRAIVVLSDGDDTASLLTFDDVLERAKRAGVGIYPISITSRSDPSRVVSSAGTRYFSQSDFALKSLARETGGRVYFPFELAELDGVYTQIANELASQYSLGYTPKNPRQDGNYRRLIVRVVSDPTAHPRTRTGYYAARPIRATFSGSRR